MRRARTAGKAAVLIAALVASGCESSVSGTPIADRQPPVAEFPSTAGYAEVDSEGFYIRDGNPEYGFTFRVANGFVCEMGTYTVWWAAHASCTGRRPDKGPGDWRVRAERFGPTTIETAPPPEPRLAPIRELPPGHFVVDSADTMCVYSSDSVLACHVGPYGFILTPDETILF